MSEEEKEAIEILKDDIVAYAVGHEKYENAVKIAVNLIDKLQKENKEYIDIFNSTEKIMNKQERTIDKLQKENMILNSHIKYIKSYLLRFIPTSTKEVEIKSKILNKIGENNND